MPNDDPGERAADPVPDAFELARELARFEERLRDETHVLQSVLDGMSEGVVVADTNGKFLFFNPAAERLLGIGPTDAPPEAWTETYGLFRADGVTPFPHDQLPLTRALRGEQADAVEIFVRHARRPDGLWILVSGRPLRGEAGELRGGVAVFHDVTGRKQAEEEVHRLTAELEERVWQRTVELEAANNELEAFCYSVSHDLRAPLRSIDGFSQAVLEDYGDRLGEEGRNYLQRVRAASQRMAQLIDDLLKLSRLTRNELRRDPVNLSALARACADELRQREPDRRVEFVVAEGVTAEGDGRLLRVALENLLGNAWKFTSRRVQARIEFGVEVRDGLPVYFVRDDGAGFDMTYAGKLFGAFQRLHSGAEFPGTGIGLAIVQRIISRHGGRVWAEGAVEKGATFYFTLWPREAVSHAP
jgi:signal transduction histidine kinase